LAAALGRATRAMDYGGGRRIHQGAVPRLGGLAIAAGIVVGAGSVALLRWEDWGPRLHMRDLLALVLASGMVFLVGALEDLVRVSPWKRFAVELLAATLMVAVGWQFHVLGVPGLGDVHLGWLAPVVTVAWLVGVTNAVNLLDGLDGLAGGVAGIIAFSYLVLCLIKGDLFSTVLMAAIAGACLGFLRHNRAPARIFMGDSGSLVLGFLIASIAVHSSLKASGAVAILVPVLALGVPVFDTLLVMLGRFVRTTPGGNVRKRVRDVFHADNSHLHHVLQRVRSHRTKVVKTIYVLVLLSCLAATYVSVSKRGGIGWLLVGGEIAVIAVVRQMQWATSLARRAAWRRSGTEEAPEIGALRPAVGHSGSIKDNSESHGVVVEIERDRWADRD